MKILIRSIAWCLLFVAPAFAGETKNPAEKKDLTEKKDRFSYSLGYDLGRNFSQNGVDLSADVLLQGLKDAMTGTKPAMSEEEMRESMTALRQDVTARQQEKRKELAERNKKDGEAFLEANKKKKGIKTLPSGLQYKVLAEGKGKSPKATDKVSVHYRGTLIDGTEFDSSHKRGQPATFVLNQVVKGWTEGVQLMKEGGKVELFLPSELAYGDRGAGPVIGPNATLIFEIELLSIEQ